MKAAALTRYGSPDVVRIVDVPMPAVGERDVLVRVCVTTVNRTDCGCRAAHPFFIRVFTGLLRPRRTILGTEFAGTVEAIGGGVTSFAVGDEVFGFHEWKFGAHAEYLSIPEGGPVTAMPANLTYEETARAPRARITPSRISGKPRSGRDRPCSSMAPPGRSGPRRSSS